MDFKRKKYTQIVKIEKCQRTFVPCEQDILIAAQWESHKLLLHLEKKHFKNALLAPRLWAWQAWEAQATAQALKEEGSLGEEHLAPQRRVLQRMHALSVRKEEDQDRLLL